MTETKEKKMRALKSAYDDCVACSGKLELIKADRSIRVEHCARCEGEHVTVSSIRYRLDYQVYFRLIPNMDDEPIQYFDITAIHGDYEFYARTHGWKIAGADYNKIVQFG